MIGVVASWSCERLPPPRAERFAGALGRGRVGASSYFVSDEILLAASGVSHGWRPARTPQGQAVLFAGWIGNREAVRCTLAIEGHEDAELYAAAFGRWGDRADLELTGEFATIVVAIDERWVRLSRSPIAAPPLHNWYGPQQLIAASTPHAIFATGVVRQEIDEQRIADSLFLNYARRRA